VRINFTRLEEANLDGALEGADLDSARLEGAQATDTTRRPDEFD
jgi:hypothetical protein